eukprot:scaffold331449_cov32-Prasinocladus_malaysianus.AAC.1
MTGPRLRFCKESNDLLYPREDRARKRLVYYCKNCDYVEDSEESDWCVYRNAVKEVKDKTVITQVESQCYPAFICHRRPFQPHAAPDQGRAVSVLQPQRKRVLYDCDVYGDDAALPVYRLRQQVAG